jgi:adenylate kinase
VVPGVRLVVLGKQGAGKGTQCVRLSHHYVVPHVSTGDMLRGEVKSGTPLGRRATELMDRGDLLPDDLIMELVGRRLHENDIRARGFILDGCPRTIFQAETLADLLVPDLLDLVIDLEVPTAQVLRRLASRRVCVDCGANYSVSKPPLTNWTCDVCGGEVVQRPDDTEEAIGRRLELYERQTAPLIEWYQRHKLLVPINGTGSADDVTRRCVKAVEARRGAAGPAAWSGGGNQ